MYVLGTGLNATIFFFFWPYHKACGILVPQPGIDPRPSPVKARSPNHWTTGEFPKLHRFSFNPHTSLLRCEGSCKYLW